jgi:hypothetical protein
MTIEPEHDPPPRRDPLDAGRVRTENLNRSAVASAPDIRTVPARARALASTLAALFEQDSVIVKRLNDAQSRLQRANLQLWSGLHPDALALLYDDTHALAITADGRVRSEVNVVISDQLRDGADERQLEAAVLKVLQEIHWTIHRAFLDHQNAGEERRQLAVDVGELSQQLTETLTAAGWTQQQARTANVNDLAEGRPDHDQR